MNIVDVRTDEETAMGSYSWSKNNSYGSNSDNLNQFNKNETYYIICAAGMRSAKVVKYLEDHDIHAINVEGGMNEWGTAGTEINSI